MKNIVIAVALSAAVVSAQTADDAKKASCAAAKLAWDNATTAGVAVDTFKKAYTDLGCGAEALVGSLAAVAVAIYATTF